MERVRRDAFGVDDRQRQNPLDVGAAGAFPRVSLSRARRPDVLDLSLEPSLDVPSGVRREKPPLARHQLESVPGRGVVGGRNEKSADRGLVLLHGEETRGRRHHPEVADVQPDSPDPRGHGVEQHGPGDAAVTADHDVPPARGSGGDVAGEGGAVAGRDVGREPFSDDAADA